MKSINKIIISLFVTCLFFGFSACTEEAEYTPEKIPASAQVYFSNKLLSKVSLSQDLNVKSYDVELLRIDKTNALTVNLTVETESPGIFTIPTTANFSAGSDATSITITYDPSKLDYDVYQSIRIAVSDINITTPYGTSVYAFTAGIPAPWKSLGEATFHDTWMFENAYSVELQQHMLDPTRFRLIDPYSQGLKEEGYVPNYNKGNQSPTVEFRVLPKGAVYKGVTTTVEGLVVYDDFCTGYYRSDYGQDVNCMHPSRFTAMPTEDYWLHNIVLKVAADGQPEVVQLAPYFYMMGVGGWNQTQADGVVTIVFPGVVLSDYSLEVTYAGKYTDAKDNIAGVLAQILEAGKDVESIRLAVVEGTDVNTAAEKIKNESIAFVEVAAKPATIQLPFATEPVAGKYTIVAVAYSNGNAQAVTSAEFKYTPPTTAETWTARGTGDYVYSLLFEDIDAGLTLYQSDTNPNRWKIEHWGYDVDFIFSYNKATGDIMVEDQEIGYVHPSYGTVMVADVVDKYGNTNYGKSRYENGVFHFALVYYVSAGVFDRGYETFTLTSSSLAPAKVNVPALLRAGNKKALINPSISSKELRRNQFIENPLK